MCTARDPVVHYYARDYVRRAHMFGGINFGNLVKNLPIRQIKIPANVFSYTVWLDMLACTLFCPGRFLSFLSSSVAILSLMHEQIMGLVLTAITCYPLF